MFVIVDLEWITDDNGHYEPTQLAAIRVNQDWDGIRYFNSFIKPRNLAECDWSHPAYTCGSRVDFANANSALSVFKAFDNWLRKDDILLFWHHESRKVWRKLNFAFFRKSDCNKDIVLDSFVYSYLKGQISSSGSPYKIAASRGVSVDIRLQHYATNDAKVLRELLQVISMPQSFFFAGSDSNKPMLERDVLLPYQYHKETNTIHRKDCELITSQNIETYGYPNLITSITYSHKFCECCKAEYKQGIIERNKNFIEKAGYNYIYSPKSKVYHKTTCRIALEMKDLVGAKKYKAVVKAGKLPCSFCKPSIEEEYESLRRHDRIIRTQTKLTHTPSQDVAKAIVRQKIAAEERERRLSDDSLTEDEKSDVYTITQPRFAFWAGRGYKNFHKHNCPRLNDVSHLQGFSTYKDAIQAGYTPCKNCRPTKKDDVIISIPITSCARENEIIDDIIPLCEEAGFTYQMEEECFYIETAVGKWKITIKSSPVKLEHINLVRQPYETEYHIQPRRFLSYIDVVEYIKRHDQDLMSKPKVI